MLTLALNQISIGGTNGESRFKAGAVPQLYSWRRAICKLQYAIGRESQKTRIRLFSTTFEVKGVGTSAVPRDCSTPLADSGKGFFFLGTPRPGAFFFHTSRRSSEQRNYRVDRYA